MRIVIVEDEPIVARRVERLARNIVGTNLERIDVAVTLDSAITLLGQAQDAVVLLDLNLSGTDGYDLLRRAAVEPFQTIVISANTHRAAEAFDLGVVDFVTKPFSEERLAKAFERLSTSDEGQDRRAAFLSVTIASRVDLVRIDKIVAIHGAGDYSELETSTGTRHLHKKTLTMLERLLPSHFQRVHRSHVVNLQFAVSVKSDAAGRHVLRLSTGSTIPLSRSYARKLKREETLVE